MMKKQLLLVAGLACSGLAWGALDSRSYVQTGLLAQWDGIENVARGTHDGTIGYWTDLTGKGHTLGNFASGYSWTENRFTFPSAAYGMCGTFTGDATTVNAADYMAWDGFYQEDGTSRANSASFLFGFGNWKGFDIYPGCNMLQLGDYQGWTLDAARMTFNEPHHVYGEYADGAFKGTKCVYDGESLPRSSNSDTWTQKTSGLGYGNNSNWSFHGGLHALRLYTKALTDAEVGLNRAIDIVRFQKKATSEVTLPAGYTWSDSGTGVAITTPLSWCATNGTVAVNGATATATGAIATGFVNDTFTLTAVPQTGYLFRGWVGDTDRIVAGSAATATMTVQATRPIAFVPIFTAVAEADVPLCAADDLIHRWSFNGSLADTVGGHTATASGDTRWDDAANPQALTLAGGTRGTSAIDLGYDNFPATNSAITIEIWAQQNAVKNWGRIFDIGNDNTSYFLFAWTQSTTYNSDCLELNLAGTQALRPLNTLCPFELGTRYHISVTIEPQANGMPLIKWAKRDSRTGAVLRSSQGSPSVAWSTEDLAHWHFWLGRSQYAADNDAAATYDEVRVWKAALTSEQLDLSARLGPDRLPTTAPISTITLTANGSGTVSVNGGDATAQVPATACVQLAATPAEGWAFVRWTGDDFSALADGTATDPVLSVWGTTNLAFTAEFINLTVPTTATWTGAAGDGNLANTANWTCYNALGTQLAETLPTAETAITVSGEVALSCPVGTALPCKSLSVSNVTLTADCDWRGLGDRFSIDGVLDLHGHTLTVAALPGAGRVTDTTGYDILDYIQSSSKQLVKTGAKAGWDTEIEFDFMSLGYTHNTTLFGAASYTSYRSLFVEQDNAFRYWGAGTTIASFVANKHLKFTVTTDGKGTLYDGDSGAQLGQAAINLTNSDNAELCLFSPSNQGTPSTYRFYGLKMKKGGVLVQDLVPARARDTGVCGVYDKVNQCFYANEYTIISVPFTAGTVTTAGTDGGELIVDVAAGTELTNSAITLDGSLGLTKTGAGTFIAARHYQNYSGGTTVAAGTFKMSNAISTYAKYKPCGALRTPITVQSGATFDVNGMADFAVYEFAFAGGAVVNTGNTLNANNCHLAYFGLTADATVSREYFVNWSNNPVVGDLAGHTLTLVDDQATYFYNVGLTKGTVVKGAGTFVISQTSLRANDTTFDLGGPLEINVAATVSNLTVRSTATTVNGGATMTILGTFTPVSDYLHNFTLASGATLDLSARTAPYLATNLQTGKTLTFAANGTFTIDLHGRTLTAGEPLIVWSAAPTGATFQWDAATAAQEGVLAPYATAAGLFYGEPAAPVAAQATWTGTANDGDVTNPANWSCTDATGAALADVVPSAATAVTIAGDDLNLQIPAGSAFAYASVTVGACSLGADCDWRGLGAHVKFTGGVIDLKDHKLYLNDLVGAATITDTMGYDYLDYIESTRAQRLDTGVIPGSNTVIELEFSTLNVVNDTTIFGTKSWSGNKYLFIEQGNYLRFYGSGANLCACPANTRLKMNLTTGHQIAITNVTTGAQLALADVNPKNDDNTQLTLFARNDGGHPGLWRLHAMKIWDGTTLVRDYVPVRNLKTGYVGLLDRVNVTLTRNSNNAYYNAETAAEFVAGPILSTSGTGAGELHLDVPADAVVTNTTFQFVGNTKFIKEGAGLYYAYIKNNSYMGGTRVAAGTYQAHNDGANNTTWSFYNAAHLGAYRSPLTVAAGATFDFGGNADLRSYRVTFEGCTVKNGIWDMNTAYGSLGYMELTDDTTFDLGGRIVFFANVPRQDFRLNGHTVTFETNGKVVAPRVANLTNGTCRIVGGGRLELYDNWDVKTLSLVTDGPISLAGNAYVKDYETTYTGCDYIYSGAVYVYGTFTPATDGFAKTILQDNTTIDLSKRTTVLNQTTAVTGTSASTFSFAADVKTVLVELGTRRPARGEQLIAWTTVPHGITFMWSGATAAWAEQTLVVTGTGLYYGGDPSSTVVARAVWTGAEDGDVTKPGNWTCSNMADVTIAGALPGEETTLVISGNVNLQAPKGTVLTYAAMDLGDCTLTADCDWRGLDVTISGTIDLKGHKLYLSALQGAGTVTDSSQLTSSMTGLLTTSDQLVWKGVKLADLGAVFGKCCGGWHGGANGETVRGFVFGDQEIDTSVEIQFQHQDGAYYKVVEACLTEKEDGVYIKGLGAHYIQASNANGQHFPDFATVLNAGLAGSTTAAGYNVWQLEAYGKPGELHLDVMEGTTALNTSLAITGNVRLVKDGAGLFLPTKTDQTYYGGTEVAAGTMRAWTCHVPLVLGYDIIVRDGAVFDMDGKATTNYRTYSYLFRTILDGGSFAPAKNDLSDGWTIVQYLSLQADSSWDAAHSTGLIGIAHRQTYLDLNGHELVVDLANGKTFYLFNTGFTAGKFTVTDGGWLRIDKTSVRAAETDFDINCALNVVVPFSVHDYTARYNYNANAGTAAMTVAGRFTPYTDYYYGCQLLDGATLDLSKRDTLWNTGSSFTGGSTNVTFAAGAAISVDVKGREFPQHWEKAGAWTTKPDATFTLTPASRADHLMMKVDDAGIWIKREMGSVIYLR